MDQPMTFVARLASLFGRRWKESCRAGAPVPIAGGCPDNCCSVRLDTLAPGTAAAVTCLEEPWTAASAKLAGLGILPGVRLRVVQRFPAFVLRLGRTELALDAGLARRIRVTPEP